MNQMGFYHGIKKMSSTTNKSGVVNVFKEAVRELETYKNYVNQNLRSKNIVLERNDKILENQFANTIVAKNSKDIILVNSKIADGEIENKLRDDLTFFLTETDWREYFKYDLEKIKEEMGKDAKCVYAVVHMDEAKPHLQAMFALQRKREKKDLYTESDIDQEKIKANLKKDFQRYNKKNNITKNNLDKVKYKDWEDYRTQFCKEKLQKKIEFQLKKKNANTDTRDYEFPSNANFRLIYENIHKNFYEKLKENEIITRYKKNIEVMLGEKVDIVEKLENPLARGQNLRAVKTQVKKDKEKSIKDFLDNKISKNQLVEKFYHDYNVLKKKEMTADEFDEKMKRTQKLIRIKDRNRHFADMMLYLPKVVENIKNSGKIFLSKEDMEKLEKFLDKDERKYGNLIEKNQKINETEVKIKETQKQLKEIKKIIADEEKTRENKRNSWKIEESEHENKRVDWKKEEIEHQEEKKELEQEKENLKEKIVQKEEKLSNLNNEIKEKTEIAKNEKKNDSEIQKKALSTAIEELYQEYKTIHKDNQKIKEKAKSKATEELKEKYKKDEGVIKKARTEAYENYKSNYKLPPEVIEKIEEKVKKEKYEEVLEDKDGKYSKQAMIKVLKNKEFVQKVIKKAIDKKKSELEKDPQKIKEMITEIKNECFFNPAKLRDSAILEELKKDWGLRGQARDSLKNDKYFKEEILNQMKTDEKMKIATEYVEKDMNSNEKTKFLKSYIDKESIKNNVSKEELEKAEEEAENEVLGEIKTENIVLYQNIMNIANFFYAWYKKFVEQELKQQFEKTTYESIYNKGISTKNPNIFNKVIKTFSKIVNFFNIKNQHKKDEEKKEIKVELEDLKERLKIKENDRTQNKAF